MTGKSILLLGLVTVLCGIARAQQAPPPPAPVVEKEVQATSERMRAIEMERFKRESQKPGPDSDAISRENRFQETKRRFEHIQKLQESIVKAYTTGREIDYEKIGNSASDMSGDALWLDRNLFGAEETDGKQSYWRSDPTRREVRDLIIRLDEAIGKFVGSRFFKRSTVVDRELFEEAQTRLRAVLLLSGRLSAAARSEK